MLRHFGVEIGAYSYGSCFDPQYFLPPVKVGRYVSIADRVCIFRRNHPIDTLSTHPFFFNVNLGLVAKDGVASTTLEIGHDAWIGGNAVITPGCRRIGIGSVVGAGAVVTKEVPDFAVVGGVPARILKMRFSSSACERILRSEWWNRPLDECLRHLREMTTPFEEIALNHPLLVSPARAQIKS
jgi:acetyltransferase-like isoleucine patch superfamily enzyme